MKTFDKKMIFLIFIILFSFASEVIASAQNDLDGDEILDSVDPETIVSLNMTLIAGEYNFKNLNITNNSILTLNANISLEGFKGVKINAESLTIEEGSSISANGKGYPEGQGIGAGIVSSTGGSGGGYGGKGGEGGLPRKSGGLTYGSAITPIDLGSGGGGPGGTYNGTQYNSTGGTGGGALLLNISGTLALYGQISANGGDAFGSYSGGGSGGSIYIVTDTLIGSGSIITDGGKSGPTSGVYAGGGGGGGRIAIYYQTSSFAGKAEALGGIGLANNGENGTVGFVDNLNNDFYAGHSWRFQENDSPFNYNNITFNGSTIIPESGVSLSAKNNIDIRGNSIINGSISLNAENLNIDEGSIISADSRGYPGGQGLGAGNASFNGGSGGGYGGKGGAGGSPIKSGGLTYGSAITPIDLGSGGGGPGGTYNGVNYNSNGGMGGGAIKLNISGAFNLNGLISVNGSNGGYPYGGGQGGGGSGGSVYIITNTFDGSGSITADGGKSGTTGGGGAGGGGGGGRIAIYYQTSSFTGKAEARGGIGLANNGEEGTSVFIDTLNNILYTGHSFIFQENDSPFIYRIFILNNSNVTTKGNVRLIANDLVLNNYSMLTISGNETLKVNDIAITNHSTFTHLSKGKIDLNLVNLNLDPTSIISANGKGYPGDNGPGAGTATFSGGGGGGYGGRGGAGGCPQNSGLSYGLSIAPIDLGSGGGGPGYTYYNVFYNSSGGSGGGLINLNIFGNLTLNGLISANGSNGGYPPDNHGDGGGGSGGSIYVKTSNLSGSGLIVANGGNSATGGGCGGGGGGGGRIAIYYQTSIFTGKTEIKGGIALPLGKNGENGTAVVSEFTYAITPNYGPNIIPINVTITGKNFTEGVGVKLARTGENDINGEDTIVLSQNLLTTRFNLSGKKTGLWDLVVILPDRNESTLPETFEIKSFIYGIFPDSGYNLTKQLVTVMGFGFKDGIAVKLSKEGEEDIIGESIEVLSNTRFTTKFNISGKAIGLWNIVVTLPGGGQEIIPDAFEILDSNGGIFFQSLKAGQSQEFEINVPNKHNLFITLQKTTLVSYGTSWYGKLSLLCEGKEIANTSGYHDLFLKIADPVPGLCSIKINANQAGSGILNVRTKLPELPSGEWVVDTVYTSYGSIWRQVEVLPNQKSLYLEAEGMGMWSHFDVYYDRIGSSKHWISQNAYPDLLTSVEIPNPDPGTYIVEFMDSAMIYGKFGWSEDQKRDILLKADAIMNVESAPDYLPIITSISPVKGGNAGFVTVEIKGGWLDSNATVTLVRSNYEDILAQNVFGSSNGTALIATFNLKGKASGEWNLTVINPNGRNVTAPNSFSIEENGKSELWVEIVGREKIRSGRPAQYILRYGNSGNIDADYPWLIFGLPSNVRYNINIPSAFYSSDQMDQMNNDSQWVTAIELLKLPAHSSYSIPVQIEVPGDTEEMIARAEITMHPDAFFRSMLNNSTSFLNVYDLGLRKADVVSITSEESGDCTNEPPAGWIILWVCSPKDCPSNGFIHIAKSLGNGDIIEINKHPNAPDLGIVKKSKYPYAGRCFQLKPNYEQDIIGKIIEAHELELKFGDPDWEDGKEWSDENEKGKWNGEICTTDDLNINNPSFETNCLGLIHYLDEPLKKLTFPEIYDLLKSENMKRFSELSYDDVKTNYKKYLGDCKPNENKEAIEILERGQKKNIKLVSSATPEDKIGPTGFDLPSTPPEERKHFIPIEQNFYYRVDFWNKEDATAPACDVYIKDQLDPKLNWSAFRFKEIGFLNWSVPLEPSQYFNVYLDTRPEMNLLVNVEGVLDSETGGVNWTFRCLDPVTLDTPEDPMAGFLPPITSSGHEIGWAGYSIEPESGLTTGTQIQNQAFVNFDGVGPFNPAPKEGPWVNTIDAVSPTSYMTATLLEGNLIQLNWTGVDDLNGSGIRDYSIYVSDNGSIYRPLLVNTINTSAVFTGESTHIYEFYSISTDNVGHIENAPDEPDASIICPWLQPIDTEPPTSVTNLTNITYASTYINWTWNDPQDTDFDKVMIYLNGIFQRNVTNGTQYYNVTVAPGTYTIGTKTVDANGNINATMVTHTATTILPTIRFINGTARQNGTNVGIPGVKLSINSLSTTSNASGFYSFAVISGTYNVTASLEPTFYKNTTSVSTALNAVVIQDIELIKKPTGDITGVVTKSS